MLSLIFQSSSTPSSSSTSNNSKNSNDKNSGTNNRETDQKDQKKKDKIEIDEKNILKCDSNTNVIQCKYIHSVVIFFTIIGCALMGTMAIVCIIKARDVQNLQKSFVQSKSTVFVSEVETIIKSYIDANYPDFGLPQDNTR